MLDKNDLKELSSLFDEVKDTPVEDFYENLPDGQYKAKIADLEVTESKAGNPMMVISYEILAGEYKNFVHKHFLLLTGGNESQLKQNINRYANAVKKLGIDTSKGLEHTFNNLGAGLDKKVTVKLETTVSGNGRSYTNTSFDVE